MRGRAAFSEQLAEDHLSDQVLPSFEELRVVHTDRFDKGFGRALDYNSATDRSGCGTEFCPNETVELTAALEEVRGNNVA